MLSRIATTAAWILLTAFAIGAVFVAFSSPLSAADVDSSPSLRSSLGGMSADNTYHLGTDDKIHVTVFGEDDLSGDFDVDSNGYVRLPLVGAIQATGLSAHELEDRITAALAQGYLNEPRVNVEITSYRPFYIIGEVNKPGQYPYVNSMSVLNAVALAGGYTEKASDSWVYVRRNGSTEEEKLAADQSTQIGPGDVVRVAPTLFWSAVNVAGPISAIVSTRWYLPTP